MFERRAFSLENEGRILSGTALHYQEVTDFGHLKETFLPGAFDPLPGDLILNRQHNRNILLARTPETLRVINSPEKLALSATLPETTEANDVLTLVRSKVLRGLSIEFRAITEDFIGGVRTISKAHLAGFGVVDKGQYSGSNDLEARAHRVNIRATIPYKKNLGCKCHKGTCDTVNFSPDTFKESLESDKEILVIAGDYAHALASRNRGGLILTNTDKGLQISIPEFVDNTAARDLIATAAGVSLLARPVFNDAEFDEVTKGGRTVANYKKANLRAILIGPSDNAEGWSPIDLEDRQLRVYKVPRIWL